MEGNFVIIKISCILLIFWPLLRNGCSMVYRGNHYFIDVKICVLHQEGLMSHILLNLTTCYIKDLLFQPNNANCSHFKLVGGVH